MTPPPRFLRDTLWRTAEFWVYGTLPAALLLLLVAPVVLHGRPAAVILTYLALPAYMLHQVEEHDADRFRTFVNHWLGPAHAGLSVLQIAVVNLGFVWLPLGLCLIAVQAIDHGWAAFAAWMMLVNGALHILQGVILGGYNPGLGTAGLLFLPLGTALLVVGRPDGHQHAVSLAMTVAIHAGIVAVARRRSPDGRP